MNTYLNELKEISNFGLTENGGIKRKSTLNMVYDMFALGGAYRNRSDEDCILLFKNAFEENQNLALKCLFYLRDCRGGQGERRFFRLCYHWLANNYPKIAEKNIKNISCYARWDDVLYSCVGTKVEKQALDFIEKQLLLDINSKTPSLLGKWMPSENASAPSTKIMGNIVREHLNMTHKQYRKTLSMLRERINIVERLMSENRWDEIEFDKIPSKAGLIYKNAFARRDLIAAKYEAFAKDEATTVNADVLYPYEVVAKARADFRSSGYWRSERIEYNGSSTDRLMLEKYWNNLKDYFNGKQSNILCVVDTSGSMRGTPIDVAISLGMYCAERAGGPFKDHYISFASRPQLIRVDGVDFVDKVRRIYQTNLCDNTNLTAVFDLLLDTIQHGNVKTQDIPETICVISDMEIDCQSYWRANTAATEMEKIRSEWTRAGYKLPRLVYWNVNARHNTILDSGPDVTFVSGMSPVIFEQVITGKNGVSLMLDKLLSTRYEAITLYD